MRNDIYNNNFFCFFCFQGIIIIPHLIFEVGVGFSVSFTEILLGRYVTGSFVRIYDMCPMAKGKVN